ncbi:hypothetical protein B7H23_10660 [Notoacmeibacter marinus]|uniref:Uncharacterized protein n=1 Tax=Notoacmeibacter marinus TaxID=1876515 RepID=A0A231UYA4_9HYPH|nr:hypothetical protein [Notoacmeibacter marinus]OXT00925.1 hypothetical protein B7H23_10660 [Notoacmeibacter marinus]
MMGPPKRPALKGLSQQIAAGRNGAGDSFVRETFRLPRPQARQTARDFLDRWPKAAYWSEVESWRIVGDDEIEFTMRRLKSAD